MNTWTDKMGYPVISVSEEQTKDGVRILKVDSKKFNADGLEGWFFSFLKGLKLIFWIILFLF